MYTIHLTVREDLAAVCVTGTLSDTDDTGYTAWLADFGPTYFHDSDLAGDPLAECFGALEHWSRQQQVHRRVASGVSQNDGV